MPRHTVWEFHVLVGVATTYQIDFCAIVCIIDMQAECENKLYSSHICDNYEQTLTLALRCTRFLLIQIGCDWILPPQRVASAVALFSVAMCRPTMRVGPDVDRYTLPLLQFIATPA